MDIPVIEGCSTRLSGYLARPSGPGPWPGVVVIHESLGADEVMRRQADRLAAAGYLAVLPDLFSDGGIARCLVGTWQALITGSGKAVQDIEASRQFLLGHPECTGRVGIIGFCMGGGFALLTAARFDVAADNYGHLPRNLAVLRDACPIVASYGGRDPLMPGNPAGRLETVLTEAGVEHDVKVYPGVGHSFLNPDDNVPLPFRPFSRVLNVGPKPDAARDAWGRIEAFFDKHLR